MIHLGVNAPPSLKAIGVSGFGVLGSCLVWSVMRSGLLRELSQRPVASVFSRLLAGTALGLLTALPAFGGEATEPGQVQVAG